MWPPALYILATLPTQRRPDRVQTGSRQRLNHSEVLTHFHPGFSARSDNPTYASPAAARASWSNSRAFASVFPG